MLDEVGEEKGIEIFQSPHEMIVIMSSKNQAIIVGSTSVNFEDFANRSVVGSQYLLADNSLVFGKACIDESIIVGSDNGMGTDCSKEVYFFEHGRINGGLVLRLG